MDVGWVALASEMHFRWGRKKKLQYQYTSVCVCVCVFRRYVSLLKNRSRDGSVDWEIKTCQGSV